MIHKGAVMQVVSNRVTLVEIDMLEFLNRRSR